MRKYKIDLKQIEFESQSNDAPKISRTQVAYPSRINFQVQINVKLANIDLRRLFFNRWAFQDIKEMAQKQDIVNFNAL